MKKLILVLAAVVLTTIAFGQVVSQPESTNKEYKNVITLDANGLLHQIFNFGGSSYFYSPYILGYKRIFKSHAIRIGIGGDFSSNNGETNDTLQNKNHRYNLNLGLGYEHYCYLGKRWNLYFGADAIFNYTFYESESSWSTTLSNVQSQKELGYGVSPLLGVQFRINSRLSVSTETSYDILYTQSVSKNHTTPPNTNYDRTAKSSGIASQFHAPVAIIFRINL